MRKRKLTDDEIEAEILADIGNPSAWEEAIYVPPSKSPRPAWVTLGRHLELSARFMFCRSCTAFGAEATLTNAQPGNVDITVVQAPGRAITIDVKTLAGRCSLSVRSLEGIDTAKDAQRKHSSPGATTGCR